MVRIMVAPLSLKLNQATLTQHQVQAAAPPPGSTLAVSPIKTPSRSSSGACSFDFPFSQKPSPQTPSSPPKNPATTTITFGLPFSKNRHHPLSSSPSRLVLLLSEPKSNHHCLLPPSLPSISETQTRRPPALILLSFLPRKTYTPSRSKSRPNRPPIAPISSSFPRKSQTQNQKTSPFPLPFLSVAGKGSSFLSHDAKASLPSLYRHTTRRPPREQDSIDVAVDASIFRSSYGHQGEGRGLPRSFQRGHTRSIQEALKTPRRR